MREIDYKIIFLKFIWERRTKKGVKMSDSQSVEAQQVARRQIINAFIWGRDGRENTDSSNSSIWFRIRTLTPIEERYWGAVEKRSPHKFQGKG